MTHAIWVNMERGLSLLVFGIVELGLILTHPRLYRRSVRRALSFGRYPFHAFPRSADEKFFWRKCFDRNPAFVRVSDKWAIRAYLAETGLDVEMTPVLWTGFSPHAVPEDFLSGQVMIKTTHDSGTNFAMWNKPPPRAVLHRRLARALARDHSRAFGEWSYRNVVPRVLVEQRIGDDDTPLSDLKIYTFGRRIERIVHIRQKADGRYGQVFEPDGQGGFVRLQRAPDVCRGRIEEPLSGTLERAVTLARDLGAPFDHIRVDFMECAGTLYLGELTVYNQAGLIADGGARPDSRISRAWDVRRSWRMRTESGGLGMRAYLVLLKRAIDRAERNRACPLV